MAKKATITWHTEVVKVTDLIENPNNPKRPDAKGRRRLLKSLNDFGVVMGGICNLDNMLIDGHSRKDVFLELGIKEVEVRKPSRMLSADEYKKMNAMFDVSSAGETDFSAIEQMFTEEVLEEWDLSKPKSKGPAAPPAQYPLVPQFDEKYTAIIIVCEKSIDTTFIKNALGIERAKSYKNSYVGETSVVTAAQFIEKWQKKSK